MSANAIGLLIALLAWVAALMRLPAWLRVFAFMAFGAMGLLLVVFGGFAYWWDSSMRPGSAGAVPMICGFVTLASLIKPLFKSFEDEAR